MKISTILVSIFLPWIAYDANLFRRRGEGRLLNLAAVTLELEEEAVRKNRGAILQRHNVIPQQYRRPKPVLRMKCNTFSGKSKDPRYSNQRKIRRMINNL